MLAAACAQAPRLDDNGPAMSVETQRPGAATAQVAPLPDRCTQETDGRGSSWDVYDADPGHAWNRLSRSLLRRVDLDANEFGRAALDPLLWPETTHLLEEDSHLEAIRQLDEFLSTGADQAVTIPLQRALLLRDLWAVFDWTTSRSDTFPAERRALQQRLAAAIQLLSLPRDEILSLPDNLQATVNSRTFAPAFQGGSPFLPAGLVGEESGWVLLGRAGGPLAMSHTESYPFFGRSVFLIYLRVPGGREAGRAFVQRLNSERGERSLAAVDLTGLEVALVRRAVLLDDRGEMTLSPLAESVQLRHFSPLQVFFQFEMNREGLRDGSSGLCPVEEEFGLFFSHGVDPFESEFFGSASIPGLCQGCHGGFDVAGVQSLLSYSRFRFDLPGGEMPVLIQTTVEREAGLVIAWKAEHASWVSLMAYWELDADEAAAD